MTKEEFIDALREKLARLPHQDREERLSFYCEMIDDRMEEGLSEVEAVAAAGPIDTIYSQIVAQVPLYRIIKDKIKPKRRLKGWEITVISTTSLIWVPLVISLLAVVIALYASLWAAVASLWAAFASLAVCAPAGLVGCIAAMIDGNMALGCLFIGASLVTAGLSVLLFFGCKWATVGSAILMKKSVLTIKKQIIKKEK